MAIRLIGCGGIGSHLASPLCRYLDAAPASAKKRREGIVFIDGDSYEAKNIDRQEFHDIGNKADITAARMRAAFPALAIEAKPHFVTEENVFLFVEDGDTVFLCVDNHATRKFLSDHCQTLDDVVLLSGGNEFTDGNVQVSVRKQGKDLTPPLTYLHPEVANPKDRNPADLNCEELAKGGEPQLIFTNLAVATHLLSAFWMVREFLAGKRELAYSEQYFDLVTGMARSVLRKPEGKPAKTRKGDKACRRT